ncbi:MAG: adenylyltransferase/cytidyltransferase family protein [Dysgonamonadaceae bacterium]|jgi:cytidyltransferase-like protein|nr:adenylyltransferase/cytidyltransferase family protein [Dysgonamonadaceae bacterium]
MSKKVFVSGCYDLLHSGHVAFFREAASYGELYVGIGSDSTVLDLKGRSTVNSEQERLYMVRSIRHVTGAWVNSGSGIMDFAEDLRRFHPDIFIVNEDGHSPAKEAICKELSIEYKILKRIPDGELPARSTTSLRGSLSSGLPYRLDLAGTWIDQPYVSGLHPGWALTISLEPVIEFNERCGMSTSTRNAAARLWPYELPPMHPEKLAELLFRYENGPGKKEISGAQDSIGICMPGLNRHYYNNEYWPEKIESIYDEDILTWLESHIFLVLLWPREQDLDLLKETCITKENVEALASAADRTWNAILKKDLKAFAEGYLDSFNAQVKMFPAMKPEKVQQAIDNYKNDVLAWKLAGAGGGGYLALISEKPVENAIGVKIRRGS